MHTTHTYTHCLTHGKTTGTETRGSFTSRQCQWLLWTRRWQDFSNWKECQLIGSNDIKDVNECVNAMKNPYTRMCMHVTLVENNCNSVSVFIVPFCQIYTLIREWMRMNTCTLTQVSVQEKNVLTFSFWPSVLITHLKSQELFPSPSCFASQLGSCWFPLFSKTSNQSHITVKDTEHNKANWSLSKCPLLLDLPSIHTGWRTSFFIPRHPKLALNLLAGVAFSLLMPPFSFQQHD